jgi:hypothetical protein
MKVFEPSGYALRISVTAMLLAGCGGSQAPIAAPGAMSQVAAPGAITQVAAIATHADPRKSWMAPDAKKNDLLYLSSHGNGDVYVYSYPHVSLKGTLTGLSSPAGECVDKSGDVFITSGSGILEYAHGGTTPIATLQDEGSPEGCAVDPKTGNLAVTNYSATSSSKAQGNVAIYTNAQGSPTYLTDSTIYHEYYCGYDNAGNLFVDGFDSGFVVKLSEIPNGRTSFKNIKLTQTIEGPGGVQWDGKHLAVGNNTEGLAKIYQFAINGEKGTKVGLTPLKRSISVTQFWIEQANVIGPEFLGDDVGIWAYPGGSAKKTITGGFDEPIGATVSEAKR